MLATAIVTGLAIYGTSGALFAIVFLVAGVTRIDPAAEHATWGFRLIIAPGVVLWWPLLAVRWIRGARRPPREVNSHRRLARRRAA